MNGFAADWLALREPADHRARNRDILDALRTEFARRGTVTVVDLGCGTGSNLRAVAPYLPAGQRWRLVDHDADLLAVARDRLTAWADSAESAGDELTLSKNDCKVIVSFEKIDLAAGLQKALDGPADLVTAAALFDLVSTAWIEGFARLVASRRSALYTALTYDGTETWQPAHASDPEILAAFHAHQGGDKGFGASAGPGASAALAREFSALGYEVRTGSSPWRLGIHDPALVHELAKGAAKAVRETGRVAEERVSAWLAARVNGAACTIGHTDVLALPRR